MELYFPHILFAKDGEIYELAEKRYIAIGSAYIFGNSLRIVLK